MPTSRASAISCRRRTSPRRCSSIYQREFPADAARSFQSVPRLRLRGRGGPAGLPWPEGSEEPATPVPYSEEVWTGLEYMFASHLIARGFVDEGLTIVRAARARHDGSRRNPWNDIECGSYYARSLSSYALFNAYIGLSFDQRADEIGFSPARSGDGDLLLVGGPRLGRDRIPRTRRRSCRSRAASLPFRASACRRLPGRVTVDGRRSSATATSSCLGGRRRLGPGERIVVGADARGAA